MRKRKLDKEDAIDLTLLSSSDDDDNNESTAAATLRVDAKEQLDTAPLLVDSSSSDDNQSEDEIRFVDEIAGTSGHDTQLPKKQKKQKKHHATGRTTNGSIDDSGKAMKTTKSINEVLRDKQRHAAAFKDTLTTNSSSTSSSSSTTSSAPKSLPPLLLSTPAAVEKHTTCFLQKDILPPDLAARLYRAMLRESTTWDRNKWYLADKLVESSHKTSFYRSAVDGGGGTDVQWYMGRKQDETPRAFVEEMEEARSIIEAFVNRWLEEKGRQRRFGLEYDGPWRANVAASNCYRGGAETVGYHADQLTYLGPYPTIASLSLGTTRTFRLRGVATLQDANAPPPRTYDIQLPHNSLCIMGAGCQERFKHTIPPARSIDVFKLRDGDKIETFIERINITFRFYRPDFPAAHTPICHCGIPTVLKADAKGKAAAHAAEPGEDVDQRMRFFWMCFAGAQNEGKKCNFFKILDMKGEKRGPCIGDAV